MSKLRWAKKTDANEKEIVRALRQVPGVSVQTGHDDILVGYAGRTWWFEIKNPNEISKDGQVYNLKRQTARKQKETEQTWCGHYQIVWKLEQILEALGIITPQDP